MDHEMLPALLDHTIRTFFPAIWQARMGDTLEVRGRSLPRLSLMRL
jgi:hypothetical protein